jgi:hypothetical protein
MFQTDQHLTAGNGRDDANLITVLERGLLVLEKANVFFIDVHIHEPT